MAIYSSRLPVMQYALRATHVLPASSDASTPGSVGVIGTKLTIQVCGLFGAPMAISFDYAHPLIGSGGTGTPFLGFDTGL